MCVTDRVVHPRVVVVVVQVQVVVVVVAAVAVVVAVVAVVAAVVVAIVGVGAVAVVVVRIVYTGARLVAFSGHSLTGIGVFVGEFVVVEGECEHGWLCSLVNFEFVRHLGKGGSGSLRGAVS